jgi:glycosyltransferase involved in cell wall biosynthesis
MKLDFQKISPNIPDSRISIINNPITGHFKLKSPKEKANGVREFITVGRLNKEKGHERLLNILAKYDKPFHYTIIGDGPLKDQLFKQIDELHLTDKVKYINFTKDVEAYLSKSDLFLQGSFVEGFPNALLESCAVGTPAIAFNAPGGTKEIIEQGVNGFLAGTEEEFLAYLKESRPLEAQKIKSSVEAKFSQEHIIRKYETLFFELMKN